MNTNFNKNQQTNSQTSAQTKAPVAIVDAAAAVKRGDPILLLPGESLSADLKESIKKLTKGKPTTPEYKKRVEDLFGLQPQQVTTEKKIFLGGFVEGEGSISMAAKKNPNGRFGIDLDPNFNLTQHINGVKHLHLALEVFGTGRITHKTNSQATLVLTIEARKSLVDVVCPFFEQYVIPYSSLAKSQRYLKWKKLLGLFDQGAHLDKDRMINELLPIWDEMRIQRGFKGATFSNLQEARDYVINFQKP
jgi:hypothetical protein